MASVRRAVRAKVGVHSARPVNADELATAVDELDSRLERLRVLMEQYFQGIEKIPPFIVQKDVDRRIWVLRREKIRNTGTRFRFQQIIQRYNTFNSYWTRILREIENGTYKRDVLRAKKRFGTAGRKEAARDGTSEPPQSVDLDMDVDLEDDLSDLGELGPLPTGSAPARPPQRPLASPVAAPPVPAAAIATPPPPRTPARPPPQRLPPSPHASGILASKVESDDDLDSMLDAALGTGERPAARVPTPAPARAPAPAFARPAPETNPFARSAAAVVKPAEDPYRRVYAQYVEARRRNGESTAGLTYENLAKSLKDTTEKLRSRSGGKSIDFEVVHKDGKTILKPVVR